jgi:hypothetical protein
MKPMHPGIDMCITPYTRYSLASNLPAEFQNVHSPGEFLTIDEATCTFWECIYERKAP